MTESEVIDALISEMQFAKNANWHQHGYLESFFKAFTEAPRDSVGVPVLHGDRIRELVSTKLGRDSTDFKSIAKILNDVSAAWDEWKYAVKNWPQS